MLRILIVDDEKPIRNLLRITLTNVGYLCDTAEDGNEALQKIDNGKYHLVLLDVMLPAINGFELMEYIKPLEIPVIFLTAKDALSERVKGLRMGADDYIVKPFEIAELLARVEVVMRRYYKTEEVFQINGLTVNCTSMKVERDGQEIALTPKEFDLLCLFLRTPNVALYREKIYEKVWGGEMQYGSKTVDLHVQRLRKKTGLENELQVVKKIGYRLEVNE